MAGVDSLRAHSDRFSPPEIIDACEGVSVAVGFGLANAIQLRGSAGSVVVDTLESEEAAAPVAAAFRERAGSPPVAIIYTHNHADHVFGARAFAGDDTPEVIAHALCEPRLLAVAGPLRETIFRRSMRQFGVYLGEGERLNAGIGPCLHLDHSSRSAWLWPTRTFEDALDIELGGMSLELRHAPGETPDQIFVWWPERRVLLPGDNIYPAFPNLYAIRGTPYRDVAQWVASLDAMRRLEAEHLVPSHGRPVSGAKAIAELLRDYRDAIAHVLDETLRGMNAGLGQGRLAERVRLPEHLRGHPWLQEHYGRIAWAVRAIFEGHLGWFSGDAADLHPLPPRARAERMVALAGSETALAEQAARAIEDGEPRWALELVGHLQELRPQDDEAARLRARALRAVAEGESAAGGRNYLLTQAREAEGTLEITPPGPQHARDEMLQGMPIATVLRTMALRLDADAAADVEGAIGFDLGEEVWTLRIRRGVVELLPERSEDVDARLVCSASMLRGVLARKDNALKALRDGELRVEGSRLRLLALLRYFRIS